MNCCMLDDPTTNLQNVRALFQLIGAWGYNKHKPRLIFTPTKPVWPYWLCYNTFTPADIAGVSPRAQTLLLFYKLISIAWCVFAGNQLIYWWTHRWGRRKSAWKCYISVTVQLTPSLGRRPPAREGQGPELLVIYIIWILLLVPGTKSPVPST